MIYTPPSGRAASNSPTTTAVKGVRSGSAATTDTSWTPVNEINKFATESAELNILIFSHKLKTDQYYISVSKEKNKKKNPYDISHGVYRPA